MQKKAPQYAMGCGKCSPGFPDLIADFAATHKAYPFPFRRNNRQNLSEMPSKITPSVGTAEGCDLLILKIKIKRSLRGGMGNLGD